MHPSATSSPESPPAIDCEAVLVYTANDIAVDKRKMDATMVESLLNFMVGDVLN